MRSDRVIAMRGPSFWRERRLPTMNVYDVTLRPLRREDAAEIVAVCRQPQVAKFLSMPIATTAIFERYFAWTQSQRRRGMCASFAVTRGTEVVGLMQIRITHPGIGEVGWLLHPRVWGTHVFATATAMLCDFAHASMGLNRLEARIATANVRAQRAFSKLGATKEGNLSGSLVLRNRRLDEELWALSIARRTVKCA